MKTFKPSQHLLSRSIGDYDCIFEGLVIKRTKKTVTIQTGMRGIRRCKIHLDMNGNEMIYPFGQYSMAPIFRA